MKRSHPELWAAVGAAFGIGCLMLLFLLLCGLVIELYLPVLLALALSVPFALVGGILAWQHKKIQTLERQVEWLIREQKR